MSNPGHNTDATLKGRWYPAPPPGLPDEGDAYTDRLTGADRKNNRPYDHARNRQCSIGWHRECTDPDGLTCQCPCHKDQHEATRPLAPVLAAAGFRLAELYDLPDATGWRVMALAGPFLAANGVADPAGLRAALEQAYQSQITDWFITDIVAATVLAVRVRGDLLRAGPEPGMVQIIAEMGR